MEERSLNGFADVPVTIEQSPSLLCEEIAQIDCLLQDPDFDAVKVLRAIGAAHWTLAMDFFMRLRDPALVLDLQHHAIAFRHLRELRHWVLLTVYLDKRDKLAFDGRKCSFLRQQLCEWFTRGMEEGGLNDDEITTVWEKYRQIVTVEEPVLRRTIEEMNSRARECQSKI